MRQPVFQTVVALGAAVHAAHAVVATHAVLVLFALDSHIVGDTGGGRDAGQGVHFHPAALAGHMKRFLLGGARDCEYIEQTQLIRVYSGFQTIKTKEILNSHTPSVVRIQHLHTE